MFILDLGIHLIFLFSIFDIYFKSPIVTNITPYQPHHEPFADRLVLFVVDGLRAESFVNYTTMPYLRSVANTKGRWGISNTRMPTESRPGHVAIIAGFYEDPSAIFKGWKENPIDFDSVFNQSTYTWCWGAYDIIDIFIKGGNNDHIIAKKFDPYDQTFSTDKNTTLLDSWVFNNVKEFFQNAKSNATINNRLHTPKVVFFLHLLGTDTSGHTHKPKTENFLTTLRFVDEGIKDIEKVVREFYSDDGKTTFLMTSDHGMTDWGSHGAGIKHETETPYVIWGSGVQQTRENIKDVETLGMSLDHRFDINQADLSPLMATMLSIPVPVNSVGKVPLDIINSTLINKAKALYSNSRQLAAQYEKKRQEIENNALPLLYKPYKPFNKEKYQEIIQFTEKILLLDENDLREYEKLVLLSEEIIHLSLSGLDYYQNYYQTPLLVLVTFSFMGWIMKLIKLLIVQTIPTFTKSSELQKQNTNRYDLIIKIMFILLSFVATSLIYVQQLPIQYFIYTLLPIFLWYAALTPCYVLMHMLKEIIRNRGAFSIGFEVVSFIVGSLALGTSFTHRWMLSIPLLGMALWPLFSSTRRRLSTPLLIIWPMGCMVLSMFSFIPVVGKETNIKLVITAGVSWVLILLIYTVKVLVPLRQNNRESKKEILLTLAQISIMATSLHNIYLQSARFDEGTAVSMYYQTEAWVIAVTSLLMPLISSRRLICRLTAIYTGILNFYLLLSVSHEGLFMVALTINVTCWIFIEFRLVHLDKIEVTKYSFEKVEADLNQSLSYERCLSREDFRRAFIFTTYIILAFFGTGNIASLNSFEVRWVTCFITSYKPFIITGLILLKTLAPFLTVACSLRAVQHLTKAPIGYLHIIVLIYSNVMGIQLLFNVKNYGSWLDIGTSISQFVIVQVITLFIVLINQIARMLTDISIYLFIRRVIGKGIKKRQ